MTVDNSRSGLQKLSDEPFTSRCLMWGCGWEVLASSEANAQRYSTAHVALEHPKTYEAVTGRTLTPDLIAVAERLMATLEESNA